MIEITATYADSLAPNSAAIKNALGLVQKNKFTSLHLSEAGDLLFGECQGSGSSGYLASADFAQPDKPVFRCSCPSRQFPCKHALGLLYAMQQGKTFTVAQIPEDLSAKREKAEKREEKRQQQEASPAADKPKKTNKAALAKKIKAQLQGLELLEKLLLELVRAGIGTVTDKTLKNLTAQAKELGNYYLPGPQNELRKLILLMQEESGGSYANSLEQLTMLHALIRKGRSHLEARLDSGSADPDPESELEELLGHSWQLAELKGHNLTSERAELLQLAFSGYDDQARQEYVDLGYWLQLDTGDIHRTLQYRPYKAARHIREEDSFIDVVQTRELYLYPGGLNRRVRYDEWQPRQPNDDDWAAVARCARRSYTDAVKTIRNQLKNPLADRMPVMLLHVAETLVTEDGGYVIRDEEGHMLPLSDIPGSGPDTVELLNYIRPERLRDIALLARFRHLPGEGRLAVQPLTVIGRDEVIRLLY
ncbi:SWIM zinc finger family protein [Paenibacillus sp. HN-1]|uniref:SWIM zinc finger family protein n=1 Tax=Paenibacillus TaxID=44249 RepID=UPI001CAA234A|nr:MULTISPECIES: SWIM zinc finger family protein [Paenibacillus]MBY9082231.1 SWIM zinc finger family protein [Paenibacillus sp. CGMCC 1.18879]MBY9087313.1 SWIM zinc finger family protein [Paenibacillus sinensis]